MQYLFFNLVGKLAKLVYSLLFPFLSNSHRSSSSPSLLIPCRRLFHPSRSTAELALDPAIPSPPYLKSPSTLLGNPLPQSMSTGAGDSTFLVGGAGPVCSGSCLEFLGSRMHRGLVGLGSLRGLLVGSLVSPRRLRRGVGGRGFRMGR